MFNNFFYFPQNYVGEDLLNFLFSFGVLRKKISILSFSPTQEVRHGDAVTALKISFQNMIGKFPTIEEQVSYWKTFLNYKMTVVES